MPPIEKTKIIGGMNMSSDNFWELFTETGDIGYYLLYLESDDGNASNNSGDTKGMQSIKT
jgi:hypothetical protein